jgi:NRPS condensation-like uncharacterized protein
MSASVLMTPERAAAAKRLPFTVIDQAIHVLDTPAEPWGIQLELAVPGHLDEDRLRAAVRSAAGAHPMARARLLPARRSDRTWWWEIADDLDLDPVRVVTCLDEPALEAVRSELYSRQIPLVEAPPFRLVLARREAGDVLLLNASHTAFDGFGCLRLLQSVARRYGHRTDPETTVGLDEARDVERHLAAPGSTARARRFRLLASKVGDLVRGPSRLARDGGRDAPGYGLHVLALGEEQSSRLKRSDATVNDLLVAALTTAIAGWNEEHGRPAGRISLLVPVNLRPRDWRQDVVTNMVLETRILTTPAERQDGPRLLAAVAAQGERIKQGAGAALVEVLGGWTSMPLWSKQPLTALLQLTGNRLVDTALITNLGSISDPPDFGPGPGRAEAAWFSAPARMPCGLSVGAVTVDGRLHLSFRYRRPLLGADAVRRLADRFVADLLVLAEGG